MADLYADKIKQLARDARQGRKLEDPQAQAYRKNPMCGDEVTVFCKTGADGSVEIGYQARGCLLTMAACARMAELAGQAGSAAELAELASGVETMFAEEIPPQMEEFTPVKAHKSRHECVLLPFKALKELVEE